MTAFELSTVILLGVAARRRRDVMDSSESRGHRARSSARAVLAGQPGHSVPASAHLPPGLWTPVQMR